ncbi:MAG: putative lipid II flippase FtsW [Solirubrobacteraceae bacterium]
MFRRRRTPVTQPLEHRLLLTATFCLLAGGAVMVYSASSARTLLEGSGNGTAYLVKYVAYGAAGLVCMHVLSRHGLEAVRKATPLVLLASFAMLLAVLIPGPGVEVNGARRWLGAGPVQFQPAEVMKLALVLHAASVIALRPKLTRDLRNLIGPVLMPGAGAIALVFLQPDLGTALVIAFTLAAMLLVAGVPIRHLLVAAAAGATVVMIFALMEPYRRARLTAFLNPWADAGDTGFQSVQAQIAFGSGGAFGVGPGQSVQKIFYLPEAHTDFILAVIGEELGVAGIVCLLFLYGMIAYAGLRTAKAAKGIYAKLLASGLTSLILCQALLNVYAVLGLAPLTGVPLPFISSGSTSLIVLLCAMGLLLNIAGGGSAHLRAITHDRPNEDRDRSRRDRGTRGPGDRSRGRAAS